MKIVFIVGRAITSITHLYKILEEAELLQSFLLFINLLTAKSRAKKFWNKGKSSKLSSGNKQLSLSQPNLAALDPDAEVKPITMYEMSLGHSVDGK